MKSQGAAGRNDRLMGCIRTSAHTNLRLAVGAASLTLLLLSGCATPPGSRAGQQTDLAAALDEAATARRQGQIPQALKLLNEAAVAHPGDKAPWLQIAQIQFDQSNYGAAILAAQEVVQRDNADTVARSIMAVSGLRVSADALAHLRQANAVNGSTRSEAESVAKIIRAAIGEPVLVPPAAPAKPAPVARRPRASSASAAPATVPPAAGPSPVGTPAAPNVSTPTATPVRAPQAATRPAAAARNPLDALK